MSSSQEVTLIVDVDNSSASFTGAWEIVEDPAWYGGKAALGDFNDSVEVLETKMSFHDNSGPVPSSGVIGQTTVWYQSPPLPDTQHTIIAQSNDSMYIDYALVKAGSTTDLSAKTIFVDNAKEDEIWYTGQWLSSVEEFFPHASPPVWQTADRTASRSNTTGDSFEFRFAGTSISVYGIFSPAQNFTVDFIMDGSAKRGEYPQDGPHDSDNGYIVNHKFYEAATVDPGNHTLTVNVTNLLEGSTFYFDYITYTPSFSFINEKPTFIRGEDQQVTMTPSSAVSPSPTVSPPPLNSSPAQSSGLPIGAIVGIVIAGLSIMTITGLCYHCSKKRSSLRREAILTSGVEPFVTRPEPISGPEPAKWRKPSTSEDITNASDSTTADEGRSHMAPLRIPQNMPEVLRRNDEIASLTTEMQNADNPTRGELFARINMLTMEVERLVRENAPPEYGGSDIGQRPNSRSGTLPSYDPRDGA